MDEVPFFENPDPRGPCGGVVPDPPLVDVDGRAFAGETIVIVELVTKRSQASADYVQALQDDARAECGPYESRTNTGATQHVRDVVLLDLDDLGVPAVGWTSTLEVDGQTSHGGASAFADEEHFVYLQVHALAPPTRGTLEALARLAAAGLRS